MTGWQISTAPEGRPHRVGPDAIAVPLRVARDGEPGLVVELMVSVAEAEQLHAALCYVLRGEPPPSGAPKCRYPVQ